MGSDDWRAGYERGVLAAVLAKGNLVSESPSVYGWADWENTSAVRDHLLTCDIEEYTINEAEWDEFEDTEVGTSHHHSIEATVWCACGEVRKRTLRRTNPVSDIIASVLGFEKVRY